MRRYVTQKWLPTLFLTTALALFFSAPAQNTTLTEIIIGDGTETSCEIPFNACSEGWPSAYTEVIYPAAALGEPCMIYSLSFDVVQECYGGYLNRNLFIYLGTTDNINHTSVTGWTPAENMTLVYENTNYLEDIFSEPGWTTLVLDHPFFYEGGNLTIGFNANTYVMNPNLFRLYGTTSQGASLKGDWAWPLPEPNSVGVISDFRPNIKLGIVSEQLIREPEVVQMGFRPNGYWIEPFYGFSYHSKTLSRCLFVL